MQEKYLTFGRVLRELDLTRDELLALINKGFLRTYRDESQQGAQGRMVFLKTEIEQYRRQRQHGLNPGQYAERARPTEYAKISDLNLTDDMASQELLPVDVSPVAPMRRPLGQIIKTQGLLTEEQIQQALMIQAKRGGVIGQILIDLGLVSEAEVLNALAIQANMELVHGLPDLPIPRNVLDLVGSALAETYHIIPIRMEDDGALLVATDQPQNIEMLEDLSRRLRIPVHGGVAGPAEIEAALQRYYQTQSHLYPQRSESGRLRVASGPPQYVGPSPDEMVRAWYDEPLPGGPALPRRVFIAMPFAPRFEPVFETIIRACHQHGLRALRVDQVPNLRNIWRAIEREIARADVVIADFTGDRHPDVANSNVVTEATIAFYKYEKPVVVITQSASSLFFDWRHQFALRYDPSPDGLEHLGRGLANRLIAEVRELDRSASDQP